VPPVADSAIVKRAEIYKRNVKRRQLGEKLGLTERVSSLSHEQIRAHQVALLRSEEECAMTLPASLTLLTFDARTLRHANRLLVANTVLAHGRNLKRARK